MTERGSKPIFGTGIRRLAILPGLLLAIAAGGSACAPPPEAIAPMAVSTLKYRGLSCAALKAQVEEYDETLARLYVRQRSAQVNDAAKGVWLLHPRATVVGPDITPEIALMKGERAAAYTVLQGRC